MRVKREHSVTITYYLLLQCAQQTDMNLLRQTQRSVLTEMAESSTSTQLQCFSVLRALGTPTRSVTNFESAQDKESSLTIDYHFDADGRPDTSFNEDSVW